ncbi:hypothetical protein Syun_028661 [Stephania yunnanensis]|uniref:DNA replication complex GINS protein SLD5 n=1 Tax=Stephania yunnanensis TaxID=152371 RepID=A0AAP0E8J1_9MAGN
MLPIQPRSLRYLIGPKRGESIAKKRNGFFFGGARVRVWERRCRSIDCNDDRCGVVEEGLEERKGSSGDFQFQHELVQRSREQVQLMTITVQMQLNFLYCFWFGCENVLWWNDVQEILDLCPSLFYIGLGLEETVEDFEQNGADPLTVSVYQMDLDRMQFLLRSYLRIRLQKIVKYVIHISKSEAWSRLSEQEQKFAKRCMDDMEKHLNQSVLSRLPYGYQSILKQSISSEEDDMVPQPHLDTYVFCKSRTPLGALQIADGEDPMDVLADFLYLFHYKSIRSFVESGQVDLF